MKKLRKVAILTIIAPLMASLVGCDDAFNPAVENHKLPEELEHMPQWAVGLLGHAYISNPLGMEAENWKWWSVATDDAVSNDVDNQFRLMAGGAWRADRNPMDNWQYLRASWQYINLFIEAATKITWAEDPVVSEMYKMRFLGDAYGMRAFYMYHLLRNHAGWGENGELLGIPIVLHSESSDTPKEELNIPRNTFKECLAQLNADADLAIQYLPEDYGNIDDKTPELIPEKYKELGAIVSTYNRVFGDGGKQRMSARIARAVKAQAALMAASPAYSEGSGVEWEDAANQMAEVLKKGLGDNPIANMDPKGHIWYADYSGWEKIAAGSGNNEVFWRSNRKNTSSIEEDMFPPSLYGKGRVNPSQNLVDAFPMADGTPINESADYDPQNPYANRDPRLDLYIIHNGSQFQNKTIVTAADGNNDDALNHFDGRSTRTGYYLKKLLVDAVSYNNGKFTGQYHIKPWMRYTEFFLGYAEAANEKWGPTGTGSNGFSAYDVIKAIRQRAGIDAADPYLEKCKNNKDLMRELIRNERRIELCFEDFRFWDLRRWKVDLNKLNETVKGMKITGNNYQVFDVESRHYQDYMYYGPVPYSELLKFDALVQNAGWESKSK